MPCRKSSAGPLSPTAMQLGVAVIAGRPCPSTRAYRRGSGRGEFVATPAPRQSCKLAEQHSRSDDALVVERDGTVAHRQVEMPQRVAARSLVGTGRIEEIAGEGA